MNFLREVCMCIVMCFEFLVLTLIACISVVSLGGSSDFICLLVRE